MRFEYSPELEAYRAEVRAFIAEHSPGVAQARRGPRARGRSRCPALRAWYAQLYAAGYLGQSWPVEYGGRPDARPEHGFIVAEELARARAWGEVGAAGLAAGALLSFGTDEQRRPSCPASAAARICGASCSASPTPAATWPRSRPARVRDGDDYVVNGQKVWTTNGHHADVGYLLARTDPSVAKQAGITAFARRHAHAGHRRPAAARDHRDQRLQRGLPRRRTHPGRPGDRRGQRRLAGGQRQPGP